MPVQPTFNNPHDISQTIDLKLSSGAFGGGNLQFPADRPKYYTVIDISQYSARIGGGTGINVGYTMAAEGSGHIVLPLPVDLLDIHRVKWEEKPIMPWATIAAAALGTIASGLSVVGTAVGAAASGAVKAVPQLIGLAPNDFQTVLFDRPEYKRHEIKFKLSPRTEDESEAVRDILVTLNNAMSPGLYGGGFLFTFPNIFQVTLKPADGFLFKFKPAVLEDLVINYVGGGLKAFYHKTQAPESVEITLHLMEIEYWLKGQFNTNNT